jgi:glycine oxidase
VTLRYDVAVVGGGIAGCAAAYYLAKGGAKVALLERGRVAGEATGASAGMLAPLAEAKKKGAFLRLVVEALKDFEGAVRDVEAVSGVSCGFTRRAILRVAFTPEDEDHYSHALDLYQISGLPFRRISGDEARQLEPALSEAALSAIHSPEEGNVVPVQLAQAFRYGARALGAYIREGAEVLGFEGDAARPIAAVLGRETVEADRFVIAAGAWSSRFAPWLGTPIPVFPVRGQIVAVKGLPVLVKHVIYSTDGYCVPWPDGRMLCGSTTEEVGYDSRTTVEGIAQVIVKGRRMIPSVAGAEVDAVWAGLRPGCEDTLPVLGPVPGSDNVWLCTGHYRNGILIGAYTARLVAESMAGTLRHELEPFSPGRFA